MPNTLTIAYVKWDPVTQIGGFIHVPGVNDEVYQEFVANNEITHYETITEDELPLLVSTESIGSEE